METPYQCNPLCYRFLNVDFRLSVAGKPAGLVDGLGSIGIKYIELEDTRLASLETGVDLIMTLLRWAIANWGLSALLATACALRSSQ